jgi:hypothetical protein
MIRSAFISDDGLYRYRLDRDNEKSNPLQMCVVMVNPSTADGTSDDATIRRLHALMDRLGYGKLVVGNLFAYRATDIKKLRTLTMREAVGPENDDHLRCMFDESHFVIFGWGQLGKLPRHLQSRWKQVYHLARVADKTPYCLGVVESDWHPRHPLYVKNDVEIKPWIPPVCIKEAA